MAAAGYRAGTYCKPAAVTPDGWFDTNECVTSAHSVEVLHTLQKMSTFTLSLRLQKYKLILKSPEGD